MSLIVFVILFFVCLIFYKPGFKFFICWITINAVLSYFIYPGIGVWGFITYLFIYSNGEEYEDRSDCRPSDHTNEKPANWYDQRHEDGTYRVKNISNTGYYYSDGKESWVGMFGEEHRSNGEIVRQNAYLPERRDIYNSAGEYVGYEYEDSFGTTRRVNKN